MSDAPRPPAFDPLFPNRPWTVCFYSYRGGVGRTTVLVDCAMKLDGFGSQQAANIAILDFDLEAPGVDEFDELKPRAAAQKGLVEYIAAYLETGVPPPLPEHVYASHTWQEHDFAALEAEALEHPARLDASDGETSMVSRGMYVVRAGRADRAYQRALANIDWRALYSERDGFLLFENLRAGLWREFACGTLLVDCRTGISGIGGVCLQHLADAVVLVFAPTHAHVAGLRRVVAALKKREQDEGRWIPRLYIANRMPESYEGKFDRPALELAKHVAELCEGRPVHEPEFDDRGFIANFERNEPYLATLAQRNRVENSTEPSSMLMDGPDNPGGWPSALHREWFVPTNWIHSSYAAFLRGLPRL